MSDKSKERHNERAT